MNNRTATKWARNPVLAAVLLFALCCRALIPTGFMPSDGRLIFCDGYMPMPAAHAAAPADTGMHMPEDGGHPPANGNAPWHRNAQLCPFAAASVAMASGHATVALAAVYSVFPGILLPVQPFVPRGTIVPTRLPRGPPSLA